MNKMPLFVTKKDVRIMLLEHIVGLAKDFVEQNELQGSRMEVAEYDTLKQALEDME